MFFPDDGKNIDRNAYEIIFCKNTDLKKKFSGVVELCFINANFYTEKYHYFQTRDNTFLYNLKTEPGRGGGC